MDKEVSKQAFTRAAEEFRKIEARSNEIWTALHDTVRNRPRRSPSPTTNPNESYLMKTTNDRVTLRLELLLAEVKEKVSTLEKIHAVCNKKVPSLVKKANAKLIDTVESEIHLQMEILRVKNKALSEFSYAGCAKPIEFRLVAAPKLCKIR
jgi:hypothetical protein